MHMAHPISLIGGRDSPSARATPMITIARFAVFATDCEVAPRYRRDLLPRDLPLQSAAISRPHPRRPAPTASRAI